MNDFKEITEKIRIFNSEREWNQFHNPKDLAIALSIETSELLELFLWERDQVIDEKKLQEELADIFIFALNLADKFDLNALDIIKEKLKQNALKYPVERSKASDKKYTDL